MGYAGQWIVERSAEELLLEFERTGRPELFEEIVRRYSGMVYHVCHRICRDKHDAEDATQAVFAALAVGRKEGSGEIRTIGPWLRQVARRVSLDIRRGKKRRQRRETLCATDGASVDPRPAASTGGLDAEEVKQLVKEELERMPVKYRLPLILHYFGGMSQEDMAKELGCRPGTLRVRLHRGRGMLAKRLAKRGVAVAGSGLGAVVLAVAVTRAVQSAVADSLAVQFGYGHAATAGGVIQAASSGPLAVMQGVATATKVKVGLAVLLLGACVVRAGAEVYEYIRPMQLRVPVPVNLDGIVRPLIDTFTNPMRVDARPVGRPGDEERAPGSEVAVEGVRGAGPVLAPPPGVMVVPPVSVPRGSGSGRDAGVCEEGVARRPVGGERQVAAGGAGQEGSGASRPVGGWGQAAGGEESEVGGGGVGRGASGGARGASAVAERSPGKGRGPKESGHGGGGGDGGVTPEVAPEPPPVAEAPLAQPPASGGGGGASSPGPGGGDGGKKVEVATAITLSPTDRVEMPVPAPAASGGTTGQQYVDADAGGTSAVLSSFTSVPLVFRGQMMMIGNAFTPGSAWTISNEPPRVTPLPISLAVAAAAAAAADTAATEPKVPTPERTYRVEEKGITGYGVVSASRVDNSGIVTASKTTSAGPETVVLDLSGVGEVTNTVDNPPNARNGWYVGPRAKLVLPRIKVSAGTGAYSWGEDPSDATPDLVNSVRLTLHDVAAAGEVGISLVAPDWPGVPALPSGERAIGLWEVDWDGVSASTGMDLLVRFDAYQAYTMGARDQDLRLLAYDEGGWQVVDDGSFFVAPAEHLVGGHVGGGVAYFAVSAPVMAVQAAGVLSGGPLFVPVTPEPTGVGVAVGGMVLLVGGRRRRKR